MIAHGLTAHVSSYFALAYVCKLPLERVPEGHAHFSETRSSCADFDIC